MLEIDKPQKLMIIVLLVSFDDLIGSGTTVRRESQIKAFPIHVVKAGDFSCVDLFHHKAISQNGYDQRVRVRFTFIGRK